MRRRQAGYVLTISVGNSNVIFGVFAGNKYLSKWRIETHAGRSADEYGAWLIAILEHVGIDYKHINGAVMASVVPSVDRAIKSLCHRFFNVKPIVVTPGIKTGVKINYGRSGDLGPDRLANVAALALAYENESAIVVDYGKVTSFDAIDASGHYLGGVVTHGIAESVQSIAESSAQLPEVSLSKPDKVIGQSINHSIQAGCYWAAIDMTEGMLKRFWKEMNIEKSKVVATGGFAKEIVSGTNIFDNVDTNLTLQGLKLIYDRNR